MTNPMLSIRIPPNTASIEDLIEDIRKQLVYLETPLCRDLMPKEHRLLRVKQVTERFREALRIKQNLKMTMANQPNGFDVIVFDELYN
jgi:hypothetical protein